MAPLGRGNSGWAVGAVAGAELSGAEESAGCPEGFLTGAPTPSGEVGLQAAKTVVIPKTKA